MMESVSRIEEVLAAFFTFSGDGALVLAADNLPPDNTPMPALMDVVAREAKGTPQRRRALRTGRSSHSGVGQAMARRVGSPCKVAAACIT